MTQSKLCVNRHTIKSIRTLTGQLSSFLRPTGTPVDAYHVVVFSPTLAMSRACLFSRDSRVTCRTRWYAETKCTCACTAPKLPKPWRTLGGGVARRTNLARTRSLAGEIRRSWSCQLRLKTSIAKIFRTPVCRPMKVIRAPRFDQFSAHRIYEVPRQISCCGPVGATTRWPFFGGPPRDDLAVHLGTVFRLFDGVRLRQF